MNKIKTKHNKSMGFLPLDFDRSKFDLYNKKLQSLHPLANIICYYALDQWERKSDEVVENNVTKNYFEGKYSNKYFYKNLDTLIEELQFSCVEGKPRYIYPLHLLKREGTFQFMLSKYKASPNSSTQALIDMSNAEKPQDNRSTINENYQYTFKDGYPFYDNQKEYKDSFFDYCFGTFDYKLTILYYLFLKYHNYSATAKVRMDDIIYMAVNNDYQARRILNIYKDKTFLYSSTFIDEYFNNDNSAKFKSMYYFIEVLKQARDFLKWVELDSFEVKVESNFDLTTIQSNESFINSQLQFMNSMSDAVQRELINTKVEWQQKKDEMLAEIEAKKNALNKAIEDKRAMVKNLVNAKSSKDATINNYIVELEKRYITE